MPEIFLVLLFLVMGVNGSVLGIMWARAAYAASDRVATICAVSLTIAILLVAAYPLVDYIGTSGL